MPSGSMPRTARWIARSEPPLAGVFGDKTAVCGVNAGHDRGLVFLERRVVGQVLRVVPVEIGERARPNEEQDGPDAEQEPEKS